MEHFQEKGFKEKNIANANIEKQNFSRNRILRSTRKVWMSMLSFNIIPGSKKKNYRLYVETQASCIRLMLQF